MRYAFFDYSIFRLFSCLENILDPFAARVDTMIELEDFSELQLSGRYIGSPCTPHRIDPKSR